MLALNSGSFSISCWILGTGLSQAGSLGRAREQAAARGTLPDHSLLRQGLPQALAVPELMTLAPGHLVSLWWTQGHRKGRFLCWSRHVLLKRCH